MSVRSPEHDNPAKQTNMKRYQLFSEFNDSAIWGVDLIDALRRAKELPRKPSVQVVPGSLSVLKSTPALKIKEVLGTVAVTGTRGHWQYEAAIIEAEDGTIHQIDAREDGTMIPAPKG